MDLVDPKLKKYMDVKIKEEKDYKLVLVIFKEVSFNSDDDDVADMFVKSYDTYLKTPGKVCFITDCRNLKSVDLGLMMRSMPKLIKLNGMAKKKIESSTVVLEEGTTTYRIAKLLENKFMWAVRGGIFSNRSEALNFIKQK